MGDEKLPVLKARELIFILERLGLCQLKNVVFSTMLFCASDFNRDLSRSHIDYGGQDISRGLLRKILRDIELSPEELKELL